MIPSPSRAGRRRVDEIVAVGHPVLTVNDREALADALAELLVADLEKSPVFTPHFDTTTQPVAVRLRRSTQRTA